LHSEQSGLNFIQDSGRLPKESAAVRTNLRLPRHADVEGEKSANNERTCEIKFG